ncbi:hypothetical protein [Aquimarina sp. I32.4]|uniref:hypothetical protein n=1 Tax=Aquimarina sp. I32.4 TaxID=2053903 RepID=UPI001304CBC7|nr:hypothetical protein [Aquimarina sp. I32.4]
MMDRIDQLIRLKATGTPLELASKLGVSKTKLYRVIRTMKALNAPMEYDVTLQSYVYVKAVGFKFGFHSRDTITNELQPFAR